MSFLHFFDGKIYTESEGIIWQLSYLWELFFKELPNFDNETKNKEFVLG